MAVNSLTDSLPTLQHCRLGREYQTGLARLGPRGVNSCVSQSQLQAPNATGRPAGAFREPFEGRKGKKKKTLQQTQFRRGLISLHSDLREQIFHPFLQLFCCKITRRPRSRLLPPIINHQRVNKTRNSRIPFAVHVNSAKTDRCGALRARLRGQRDRKLFL